jgi:hypothetical protein
MIGTSLKPHQLLRKTNENDRLRLAYGTIYKIS